ncbi:MAG: FkbM family methyltransferase [Taibaiella sp.]|nr:FkbM family methyltransferase [Taibaiella sp.]
MITKPFRNLKTFLLPKGQAYRRIPFGVGAGLEFPIDFRYQAMLYLGMYEMELNSFFRELVTPGTKCFDVGGNHGFTALVLAKLSHGAPIVSFEPAPINIQRMQEAFARNQFEVTAVQVYIGATSSNQHLTLDEACERYFVPDFIKMDIDGAEIDALMGGEVLFSKWRPQMILETHGEEVEVRCIEILERYQYAIQIVDQRRWFKENRPIGHNRWLICRA